jgi:HEPN domain-containing protein
LREKVKYWIDLSDYDFETAEAMLSSGRYLYVGFMCHQTIEKIIKASFCSKFDEPSPFSHNLSYLAGKSGIGGIIPEDFKEFITLLEPLNIEARYPTHKEQLLKSLTKTRCKEILIKTKELQTWVKERL